VPIYHVIPEDVRELCRRIEKAGFRAWVVGGCVRDLLMGKPISDWDLATSAHPGDVQAIFRRTIPTGIQHGTVTVLHRGHPYEVTTLRGEGAYTDGRRPDSVELGVDLERDLERRDFTVNAIAYDPIQREIVDPWGGQADIASKIIRAVRDPRLRFGEDGLRVLRAARFCATLGFTIDPATEAAIAPSLGTFRKVSIERVHEEWRKALAAERPSPAFEVMRRTGILAITCEPLAALDDATFAATMARVDRAPRVHELRIAALLADVGQRPLPVWADGWLREMRAANDERKRVVHVLAHREIPEALDGAGLRHWLRAVGRDAVGDVLALARAGSRDVDELERRAKWELEHALPLAPRELPITGDDVIAAIGGAPGRHVGRILERMLSLVLDDPALNDRDALLARLPQAARDVMEER
jgi:tRNA nucleotidyltransferase (CCA-adding enzyme)